MARSECVAAAAGCVILGVLASVVPSLAGCGAAPSDAWAFGERPSVPLVVGPALPPWRQKRPSLGPPPPGYERIVGHADPEWDSPPFNPRANPLAWTFVGPRPITNEYWSGNANASGRVVSIAAHPTDSNIAYAASASGGLWKTTNGGTSWTPKSDELSVLNHGFVVLDAADPSRVFLGTGEYTTQSTGDGLFRSDDGGDNWTRIATAAQVGSQISGIALAPGNSNIIHVTGTRGYVRSLDGGATWSQRRGGSASSLVVHPTDPNILFVGIGNDGVYRSTNGGGSITRLATGLPAAGSVGRVMLAISRSDPLVVYAAVGNRSSGLEGLYRSADGGTTWTRKAATPNFPSPQGWYDMFIGVDPASPDTVYCGGVDPRYATAGVIKTTNGGDSWTEISAGPLGGQLHPDHHAIAFGAGGIMWCGNDGGVWKSANGGQSWINCNANLAVTQFYALAVHPTDVNRLIGGTQDNGTARRTGNVQNWPQALAGDGGFTCFDFTNPTRYYSTYVYLTIYRTTSGGTANISGPWSGEPSNFIAPLVMDPNNARTLLGGTNRVWRTTNADAGTPTWTAISPTSVANGGTLNAIAVAPGSSATIYTASSTGRVSVTTDGGTTWATRSTGLPAESISDIVVSPTDPSTAYVSFYRTTGGRVFKTTNAGVNWTSVSAGLPTGVGATALAVDFATGNNTLFVGSGAGVYVSFNGGVTWIKDGTDLPNVNVGDLQIDVRTRTIYAGTYGRGAWRASLPFCPADFNQDSFVDFFDYDAFVLCFEDSNCPPGKTADFNDDGFVDFFDFDDFVTAFSGGC
jgi:photosystem II stability/assembly factor-like uncharacterized protein